MPQWILLYVDDISLVCDSAEKLREAVTVMDATFLLWGLTIRLSKKAKALVVGRMLQLKLQIQSSPCVGRWCLCLNCWAAFSPDCTLDAEIKHAANSAFQQLRQANIWSSRALTLSVKMRFFQCIVMSVLLYTGRHGLLDITPPLWLSFR